MKTLHKRQNGSALFICLMLLVILSLLGISALRMTLGQNLIALNSHSSKLAFEAADSATSSVIRQAELAEELVSREIIPEQLGATITLDPIVDDKGITESVVTVERLDPEGNPALQERNLQMIARLEGMGSLKVEAEAHSFTSEAVVPAVDAQATTVQETFYMHLAL